ncbi:hypothetical protein N7447_004624 [Penicillium robsamsonii]|uniref:uncharacterized protein n=1 Tax=Penicillium robsamsonii TaxID=1792511 RepID=UPI00254776C7|nr:uncharacterized protein N7447_004624 [Penicillium robsamsonii]KAJ5827861.1 hypothetical protein N7447_004624 [Penicillium robsamsonii]
MLGAASPKRGFEVDTGARNSRVPGSCNRSALEDTHDNDSNSPRERYPTQDHGGSPYFLCGKDATVHEQDRKFGDYYRCDIEMHSNTTRS